MVKSPCQSQVNSAFEMHNRFNLSYLFNLLGIKRTKKSKAPPEVTNSTDNIDVEFLM